MPRTVYAVSSGEYSDYRIHCLFEREQDAQAHEEKVKALSSSFCRDGFIEEFQLFAEGEDSSVRPAWRGVAEKRDDGWHFRAYYNGALWGDDPSPWYGDGSKPVILCTGSSEEQVLKALSDYVAEWKGANKA